MENTTLQLCFKKIKRTANENYFTTSGKKQLCKQNVTIDTFQKLEMRMDVISLTEKPIK